MRRTISVNTYQMYECSREGVPIPQTKAFKSMEPHNFKIVGEGAKLSGIFIYTYHKRQFIALLRAKSQIFRNLDDQYLLDNKQQAVACFTSL
jgi:hypothetical protein